MTGSTQLPDGATVTTPSSTGALAELCASCGAQRSGRFCHACGEKRLEPGQDHSLRWFLGQVIAGFTNLDSKFLRTFAALLCQPGRLSQDFLRGRRVRWMPPLQVFVVASVLFYCFFEHTYAAPVSALASSYVRGVWFGNVLHYDIAGHLTATAAATQQNIDVLAMRVFDRANQNSKLFLGLLVPFLAGTLQLLFLRRQPRFVPHLVAAVHMFSFYLVIVLVFMLCCSLAGMNEISDLAVAPLFAAFGAYGFFACRRTYGAGAIEALWKVLVVVLSFIITLVVYRQIVTVVAAELI